MKPTSQSITPIFPLHFVNPDLFVDRVIARKHRCAIWANSCGFQISYLLINGDKPRYSKQYAVKCKHKSVQSV